jgi:hypothetical protein
MKTSNLPIIGEFQSRTQNELYYSFFCGLIKSEKMTCPKIKRGKISEVYTNEYSL